MITSLPAIRPCSSPHQTRTLTAGVTIGLCCSSSLAPAPESPRPSMSKPRICRWTVHARRSSFAARVARNPSCLRGATSSRRSRHCCAARHPRSARCHPSLCCVVRDDGDGGNRSLTSTRIRDPVVADGTSPASARATDKPPRSRSSLGWESRRWRTVRMALLRRAGFACRTRRGAIAPRSA